jgi:hypothetical protein
MALPVITISGLVTSHGYWGDITNNKISAGTETLAMPNTIAMKNTRPSSQNPGFICASPSSAGH